MRLDAGDLVRWRRDAVERHGSAQIGQACGEQVGDAAAIAETDDAKLARTGLVPLEKIRRGDEVFCCLRLLELGEQFARLVLVTRIAAQRKQRVGREDEEILERQATRDVLD